MNIHHRSDDTYIVTDMVLEDIHRLTYCVFDFEATGPDPLQDHITQIGAVVMEQDGANARQFNALVRPGRPIPEIIERLTGIMNRDVEHAPALPDAMADFMSFFHGCILVTQAGYEYDLPLWREECKRHHIEFGEPAVIDTKALFTWLHPECADIVSTNFLICYYGIEDSDLARHDALGDSMLIARIFNQMIDECRARGITTIRFDQLQVKKVKLKPLT